MTSKTIEHKHNGKSVGHLSRDGKTYFTSRQRGIHLARKHNGYGIQSSLLRTLIDAKVQEVILDELVHPNSGPGSMNFRYHTTLDLWVRGSLDILRAQDGAQRFLSLKQLRDFDAHVRSNPPKFGEPLHQWFCTDITCSCPAGVRGRA